MTIRDLGRWESLERVQCYARWVTFNGVNEVPRSALAIGESWLGVIKTEIEALWVLGN